MRLIAWIGKTTKIGLASNPFKPQVEGLSTGLLIFASCDSMGLADSMLRIHRWSFPISKQPRRVSAPLSPKLEKVQQVMLHNFKTYKLHGQSLTVLR
jgi:hypothetical protein